MRYVTVEIVEIGEHFGCVAIIRDACSGRKLAETPTLRPYGFTSAAFNDARKIIDKYGWSLDDCTATHRDDLVWE